MMKRKFQRMQIRAGAAHELLTTLDRFIYDRPMHSVEAFHFNEIPLTEYALAAATVEIRTALHKVLYDLAYVDFFLYGYDDALLEPELLDEFNSFVTWIFSEMGKITPPGFSSTDPAEVRHARNSYSNIFLEGLHSIVDSAFAVAWERKTLLHEFNKKLALRILPLRKSDCPVLASDGRLPRAQSLPTWLISAVQKRDRGLCQHCGEPVLAVFGSDEPPHFDHMVALALGGGNDATNFLLSCGRCNLSKGAKEVHIKDEFSWPNARP